MRRLFLLASLALGACNEPAPAREAPLAGVSAVDDSGAELRLDRPAARVVSLVPSATETLVAVGALPQLVGRNRHDTAPTVQSLPSVGGMLDPSLESLLALGPDLVVALADDKGARLRERLRAAGVPVFAVYARDTADVFRNIHRLGRLTGHASGADSLTASLRAELEAVRASVAGRPAPRVLYVVWHDPPTVAGPRTFISQVIEAAGGRAALPDLAEDWPQVSLEALVRSQPDVVVVPVGDDPAHTVGRLLDAPGWRELRAVRDGRIVRVPSDLVNRPGPHLAEAARVLRDALHPGAAR